MDARAEVSEFLTNRRARLKPQDADLPFVGGGRRVPGLRREEVALLAGVSVDYYIRLERGNVDGVSDGVLRAVAGALRLDEVEQNHLVDLVRACRSCVPTERTESESSASDIRSSVKWILDSMTASAALVRDHRFDVIASNPLGEALYSHMLDGRAGKPNVARFVFLDPRARIFYMDWEKTAEDTVAVVRAATGRKPHDQILADLIAELREHSSAFAAYWAMHNVRFHASGPKDIRHHRAGVLHLQYERLQFETDRSEMSMYAYVALPGSRSEQALRGLTPGN